MVFSRHLSPLPTFLTIFSTLSLCTTAAMPTPQPILSVQAQTSIPATPPIPNLPPFEVVSIKQNLDPNSRFTLRFTPDGFSARNCRLKTLILVAFDLRDDRLLVNLPHDKEAFYDVEAKVAEADLPRVKQLSDTQKHAMLQSILIDRFHLKVHTISKELPVYALVIDKHGLKLADAKPNAAGKIAPDMQLTGRYTVVGTGWSTEDFFQFLAEMSGRYIVDRTGLTGRYDFTLRCAPDPSTDSRQDVQWDGPVIFTALREQLGLALEPSTATLDAIMIDHVEAPTPN